MDPRNYQIVVLCCFVVAGKFWLGFDFQLSIALCIIACALCVQRVFIGHQYKSALISSLSLVLLLRTDSLVLAALAAAIAIGGKRFIRFNNRHIFNPSALALVVVTVLFDGAWLAPGQWGPMGLSVLLLAGAGLLVVTRAKRIDIALTFFVSFAIIVVLRGLWLGDPLTIATHQLQNGALIVFAFFMITDPVTTPATTEFRMLQGVLVAVLAAILQYHFYLSSAPLFALVMLAPLFALPLFQKDSANEKNTASTHAFDRYYAGRSGFSFLRILRRQG